MPVWDSGATEGSLTPWAALPALPSSLLFKPPNQDTHSVIESGSRTGMGNSGEDPYLQSSESRKQERSPGSLHSTWAVCLRGSRDCPTGQLLIQTKARESLEEALGEKFCHILYRIPGYLEVSVENGKR